MSLIAYGCRLAPALPVLAGSFTVDITAAVDDGERPPATLEASGRFEGFSVGTARLSGAYRLKALPLADGQASLQVAYSSVTTTSHGRAVMYNATLSAVQQADGRLQYAMGGDVQVANQHLMLQQQQPFSNAGQGTPLEGQLQLQDSVGNALVLSARPDGRVDFGFHPQHSIRATTGRLNQWLAQAGVNL
jgi:hypothetical protein